MRTLGSKNSPLKARTRAAPHQRTCCLGFVPPSSAPTTAKRPTPAGVLRTRRAQEAEEDAAETLLAGSAPEPGPGDSHETPRPRDSTDYGARGRPQPPAAGAASRGLAATLRAAPPGHSAAHVGNKGPPGAHSPSSTRFANSLSTRYRQRTAPLTSVSGVAPPHPPEVRPSGRGRK